MSPQTLFWTQFGPHVVFFWKHGSRLAPQAKLQSWQGSCIDPILLKCSLESELFSWKFPPTFHFLLNTYLLCLHSVFTIQKLVLKKSQIFRPLLSLVPPVWTSFLFLRNLLLGKSEPKKRLCACYFWSFLSKCSSVDFLLEGEDPRRRRCDVAMWRRNKFGIPRPLSHRT